MAMPIDSVLSLAFLVAFVADYAVRDPTLMLQRAGLRGLQRLATTKPSASSSDIAETPCI
ncbi:hypothetical protein [Lactiplantibacillus pentosus]|uniref:hypothetical protein n=1 Tax=Lactiplantibacillus pentosus TaxID=1589 RepID=UPI0013306216|nr:hypothetical protein [Lactiplantibacillus pentosus]MBQ0837728.1 hypothetical protein [Lactiplantibacillus pentosus]MBU7465652.1 hypothetical protein [Lactiplantibacillus pentosus]MBU7491514.1 hypothetical protein [Lactiplantibacillus pentosus]MBU7493705.1 hypothetical protein [Lactiplantibacillus pentosus]MBU7519699.1 hypothetical protein [Lactiplantibacillus pentosus]